MRKKLKIKIEDLFRILKYTDPGEYTPNNIIKIKNHENNFVDIKKFIVNKISSFTVELNNGYKFYASEEHIVLTKLGEKKLKDISFDDDILLCVDGNISYTKLKSLKKHKEEDILYDFELDPPHLYKDSYGVIHHNSLAVSFIINNLEKITRQQLIIVPNISLIEQFHSDMTEYGIAPVKIGKVGDGNLEFDKKIVISTWQTLANNLDKLDLYDTVICDETHAVKALVVRTLLSQMPRARYRFGFTGTLPDNKLDMWNIVSFLGPVLLDISSAKLADEGYVSYCNVNLVNMHYSDKYGGTYSEMKEKIFNIPFRLNFIKDIIEKVDSNFLILVGMVRKEGQVLLDYLKEQLPNKEVIFLSGKDPSEERELWRKNMDKDSNLVLIATYPIFQQGINIPSLKYLIFAAPYKSKIRVLQSIGRTLRKHDTKDTGAEIIDIIDHTKYFKKQSVDRLKHYINEEFNVREFDIYEDRYSIDSLIKEIT